jgi:lysozyme family protein
MFEKIINFICSPAIEGGVSNHKNDSGGLTNLGVTQKTYDLWREKHGLEKRSVRLCTREEALTLYREEYWKEEWEQLGLPLAACCLDTAINSGMGRALKFLRQCEGNYVNYLQRRLAFYQEIADNRPDQKVFHQGWKNRITKLRRWIDGENQQG